MLLRTIADSNHVIERVAVRRHVGDAFYFEARVLHAGRFGERTRACDFFVRRIDPEKFALPAGQGPRIDVGARMRGMWR